MKWLVTGGAGYIGSVVAELLIARGDEVVVLDDLSRGHEGAIPPGARFVRGRVHDAAQEVLDASYDGVLHFAGFILAGESVGVPEQYWENNLVGTLRLLAAMRRHGVGRMVFSSTANVYGDPDAIPIPEDAPVRPPNPYATSKLAADHALTGEAVAHGLAVTSLRYFNVVGAHRAAAREGAPERLMGERHEPESHLIPLALAAVAGDLPALALYGDDYDTPDGTCIRDYIHVSDLAAAHLHALAEMKPGYHRIYNLGNGRGFSNLEVLRVVGDVTGREVPVAMAPRRAGDPAVLVASSERARTELGWTPRFPDLATMVADAWEFYRAG